MARNLKTLMALAATLLMSATCATAQTTTIKSREAFVDAPRQIFPLLDQTTRLDMIDYFNSGIDRASKNTLDGNTQIVAMTDDDMTVKLTDASSVQLAILPGKQDPYVLVISTIKTPTPDSKLAVYDKGWNAVTTKAFTAPQLSEWLTADGKKRRDEVEMLVPFLLISYSYNPATGSLVMTNNTKSFLSDDVYSIVADCFKPSLVYEWDGSKFKASK